MLTASNESICTVCYLRFPCDKVWSHQRVGMALLIPFVWRDYTKKMLNLSSQILLKYKHDFLLKYFVPCSSVRIKIKVIECCKLIPSNPELQEELGGRGSAILQPCSVACNLSTTPVVPVCITSPLRSLGKASFCHSSCLSLCLFFAFIGTFQGYWFPGHFIFTLHSQSFLYLWDLRAHLPLLSSESPPTSQKTSPHPKHSTRDKIRTSLSLSAAQHILFKECKISNT